MHGIEENKQPLSEHDKLRTKKSLSGIKQGPVLSMPYWTKQSKNTIIIYTRNIDWKIRNTWYMREKWAWATMESVNSSGIIQ